jgi:hypothetical protein
MKPFALRIIAIWITFFGVATDRSPANPVTQGDRSCNHHAFFPAGGRVNAYSEIGGGFRSRPKDFHSPRRVYTSAGNAACMALAQP